MNFGLNVELEIVMKNAILVLVMLMTTQNLMAFCKAEGLQRDIEVITSRGDLSIDERRKDINHAKISFKEDVIECAVNGEGISDKAAKLAIMYIHNDSTTRTGQATDALIEMINSRVPKN